MKILQLCGCGISAPSITEEFKRLGHEVILADCNPIGGAKQIPRPTEKNFIEEVEETCEAYRIDMVLPHNHIEAEKLSECQSILTILPPPVALRNANDKSKMLEMLGQEYRVIHWQDIFDIDLFDRQLSQYEFDLLKPVSGCGGQGIIDRVGISNKYLLQHRLKGDEYTIDAICNQGKVIDWCVRKRLKAHGGICIDAEVLGRPGHIEKPLESFVHLFGWHGPMALQGFWLEGEKSDLVEGEMKEPTFTITDCNPRFGGGVGMSILAGWQGIEQYCRIVEGKSPLEQGPIKKIRVRRYYREEII